MGLCKAGHKREFISKGKSAKMPFCGKGESQKTDDTDLSLKGYDSVCLDKTALVVLNKSVKDSLLHITLNAEVGTAIDQRSVMEFGCSESGKYVYSVDDNCL